MSFAKGDFDAETKLVQKFAADLIMLDRVMRQYGPETGEARDQLHAHRPEDHSDLAGGGERTRRVPPG